MIIPPAAFSFLIANDISGVGLNSLKMYTFIPLLDKRAAQSKQNFLEL